MSALEALKSWAKEVPTKKAHIKIMIKFRVRMIVSPIKIYSIETIRLYLSKICACQL